MENVSNAYKQSMSSPLREQAFMELSFNLTDIELQSKVSIDKNYVAYYSSPNIFKGTYSESDYATLELRFTKADGSKYFLPREQAGNFMDTGLVSKYLVDDRKCEILFILSEHHTVNVPGLTMTFDGNYPVNFDIIADTGYTIKVENNNKSKWSSKEKMFNIRWFKLVVYKTILSQRRLRIKAMGFGYTLIYDNSLIISSSLDTYVSQINEKVPQIDFSIQLDNHDGHFNIDNPESVVHFFESGQEMDVKYGYKLPDSNNIEWITGGHLLCSSWEVNNTFVTIRGEDVFRKMDSEYTKGVTLGGTSNRVTMYELAERVLKEMKVSKYYLDPVLKSYSTQNAIPKVKCKEALQMIANACRCTLLQARNGEIQIKFIPKPLVHPINLTLTKSDMMSPLKTVKLEDVKEIIVPYHVYTPITSQEETLISENVQASVGKIDTFYFDKPSHSRVCYLNNSSNNITIKDEGAYFITVEYKMNGSYPLFIKGKRYNVLTKYVTKTINTKGKTITWDNPLIDTEGKAMNIADWLGEYYKVNTEYEYDTRGNPELDTMDYIYQENDFQPNMIVNVCRHSINFNQFFSGKVTTRKSGG